MKSIETQFSEALESLNTEQRSRFNAKRQTGMTIETQLNIIESIKKPINKHNGAGDNGGVVSEADPREALVKSYVATGCTVAKARKCLGLPAKTFAEASSKWGLNELQYRQYSAYVGAGISETEAVLMASPTMTERLEEAISHRRSAAEFLESIR